MIILIQREGEYVLFQYKKKKINKLNAHQPNVIDDNLNVQDIFDYEYFF